IPIIVVVVVDDPNVVPALVYRPTLSSPLAHTTAVAIKGLAGINRITQTGPVCTGTSGEAVGAGVVVVFGGILCKEGTGTAAIRHDYPGGVIGGADYARRE